MKKFIITSILGFLIAAGTTIKAQNQPDEYLGLPGDNLNLYAVMNLFQESKTLEDFERSLNDPDTKINNLDLNGDNLVDYIMVNDYRDGDDHNIVMSVALNANEKQDVGVFTVQKFPNGAVQVQLIGDEALYGSNYIIEPIYDDERPNPGYRGRRNSVSYVTTTTFEVAAWPMIRFIYAPGYPMWHSSWYWGYYPTYWNPWRPYYYHYYYGYHHHWYPMYYQHYRHWNEPRYSHYHNNYYNHLRSYSPQVSSRIRSGVYRTTYSHPEQRREGEMYARSHSRNSRPATMSSQRRSNAENNSMRRSSNENSSMRRDNGSIKGQNNGRQERPVNNRSSNSVNERQNNGNGPGRSSSSINERNGRQVNQGSSRPVMNQPSEQRARQYGRSNSNAGNNQAVNSKQQRSYTPERSANVSRNSRNESVSRNSDSPKRSPAVSGRSNQRTEARASRQARSETASRTRSESGSKTKESKSSSGSRKSDDSSRSERSGRR